MTAVDAFDGFEVRQCRCGCREPAFGWFAGGGSAATYYLSCPTCGHWAQGADAAAAVTRWNVGGKVAA